MADRFVLLGAAGFVAPRHMKAIKDVGGELVAAMDLSDSVGVLDSYFPKCEFFTSHEKLDEFCTDHPVDYICIATPNHYHLPHILWGLQVGAQVICEKPLVLTTAELEAVRDHGGDGRVWGMYQLRIHPSTEALLAEDSWDANGCQIRYITPRGAWYRSSWKTNIAKSGGIGTNIGCHLFDLCAHVFGRMYGWKVYQNDWDQMSGVLNVGRCTVFWELSTEEAEKPCRLFKLNGKEFDFTNAFAELHSEMYRRILEGRGAGLSDLEESIKITETIRWGGQP